ncbi:MAG TPA: ABC transporter permease [Gemmatimonadaceae bacterium]
MAEWRRILRERLAPMALAPADEAEIVEELAQHLEAQFAELAPRAGAAEAERLLTAQLDDGRLRDLARARRAARRPEPVATGPWSAAAALQRLGADVRYAARRSRRHLAFTAIAVLSLAIGIGANTAIFSLIDAIMLRRPPVPHREQVAELFQHQRTFPYAPFSYPDYVDLRNESHGIFSRISVAQFAGVPRDLGDHVETLFAELVNGDYFPLLDLPPQAGRLLGPEDDVANGAHAVVVLANDFWKSAFGGDRSVVGRQMRLAGRDYTIVGVAPAGYEGSFPGVEPAIYAPIRMINQIQAGSGDQLASRTAHSLFTKVRLAPGVSMAQLRTFAVSFTADMARRYPDAWPANTSTTVVPETQVAVNPMIDSVVVPAAAALMVVVALVLLVACANLASFLLAQARDRQREFAIRIALGARRWPLVQQLLVESLLLAGVGAVAGIGVSRVALRALLGANLPVPLPIHLDVSLDPRVLAFTLLATVVAAVLIGLLPALQATRPDVVDVIKSENTGGGPPRRVTMRSALVVGQIAVSLVLLITAALFLRSLQAREHIDPGFGRAPAAMVWLGIPADRDSAGRRQLLLDDIEARTRRIDGVESVGLIDNILLDVTSTQAAYVNVPGFTPPKGEPGFEVDDAAVDSGFFSAAGVTLVRGRGIASTDRAGTPPVAVINELMARTFWPNGDPIGRTFRADSLTYRVVGVSRDTKVRSLTEAPRPFYFVSLQQRSSPYLMLVARTRGDAAATTPEVIAAMHAADPEVMILQGTTMARHLASNMLPTRLGTIAFGLFAAVALALAMIGVYGVVSYAVARRAREVGIRMALGAEPRAIVRLLMREGLAVVLVGGVLGLALAAAVTRALQGLLSGVAAVDPLTFAAAPLVLIGVGALATFIPARRSVHTDPVVVLRAE